jgi:hypothetical protein
VLGKVFGRWVGLTRVGKRSTKHQEGSNDSWRESKQEFGENPSTVNKEITRGGV